MLDQFAALDDATPPEPDAAMLARVRGGADRRRRRSRFTIAGASIVSLVVVVGAVAVVRDGGRKVDVIGPSASTTTLPSTPKPVSEATLGNGLDVRMTLTTPTVVLGDEIKAAVKVRNATNTKKDIGVGTIQCALGIGPVLRDARGRDVSDGIHGIGCYLPAQTIAPGSSVSFPVLLSTDPVAIPKGQRSARFALRLELVPMVTEPAWKTPPISVEIVAPSLSARLELSKTTYTAGDDARGTLVIDNQGGSPVHYVVLCGEPPWEVLLAERGVALPIPKEQPACQRKQAALPRGSSRLPFSVPLRYSSCGHPGIPLAGIPDCVEGAIPPGTYPPLPPGTYEIVFNGRGAFGSVEVATVPIRVVAAPAQ